MAPVFDGFAREKCGIFARLDIEVMDEQALTEGVRILPAFNVYRDRVKVAGIVGEYEAELNTMVETYCG